MKRRRLIGLLAASVLAPRAARAKEAGGDGKTRFTKLQPISLELWDQNGLFHQVFMDLILVHGEEAKVDKSVAEQIRKRLSTIPYEDYANANPAPMIKAQALEVIRKLPGGDQIQEVLINKLLFR
jgi:hypothetical protein